MTLDEAMLVFERETPCGHEEVELICVDAVHARCVKCAAAGVYLEDGAALRRQWVPDALSFIRNEFARLELERGQHTLRYNDLVESYAAQCQRRKDVEEQLWAIKGDTRGPGQHTFAVYVIESNPKGQPKTRLNTTVEAHPNSMDAVRDWLDAHASHLEDYTVFENTDCLVEIKL